MVLKGDKFNSYNLEKNDSGIAKWGSKFKSKLGKLVLMLGVSVTLVACGGGGDEPTPEHHYFFGDSITLGYGVADSDTYVAVYAKRLGAARVDRVPTPNPANGDISDATLPGPTTGVSHIKVTRDGGGGRPVLAQNGVGLLRDYMTTVRPQAPFDVLVLQTGINDSISGLRYQTPDKFRINLTKLVQLAKPDTKRLFMIAPTYAAPIVQDSVAPYTLVMREVGAANGVKVITPSSQASWYSQADIYHPTAAGYSVIGNEVFDVINK